MTEEQFPKNAPALSVPSPEGGPTPTRDRIALVRCAAEGRREYAAGLGEDEANPALREQRAALLAAAAALESAAKIMEGDNGPLYGLLPSWRWTDEQVCALSTPAASPSPILGAGDSTAPEEDERELTVAEQLEEVTRQRDHMALSMTVATEAAGVTWDPSQKWLTAMRGVEREIQRLRNEVRSLQGLPLFDFANTSAGSVVPTDSTENGG